MMCKYMRKIEEEFDFLPYERIDRIKSTVCGQLCGGVCNKDYLEHLDINIKDKA